MRYGRQQGEILDPRSQSEDLGDDAVKASEYGVKNLKYVLENLESWLEDDKDFSYRRGVYEWVMMQYLGYIGHVYANVGGVWLYEKHAGDDVPFYEVVPAERQKESMSFLLHQLDDLNWLDAKDLLTDMPLMAYPSDLVRDHIVKLVLGCPAKLDLPSSKANGEPYTVEQGLEDVYKYVWGPAKRREVLTEAQMKTQKLFLKYIGSGAGVNIAGGSSASLRDLISEDVRAWKPEDVSASGEPNLAYYVPKQYEELYYGYLMKIKKLLKKMSNHRDKATKLHYQLMARKLENSLK